MAERMLRYYQYIKEKKGFDGQVKLAQETKIPSTKAAIEPDSPENIRQFRAAIKTITGADAPDFQDSFRVRIEWDIFANTLPGIQSTDVEVRRALQSQKVAQDTNGLAEQLKQLAAQYRL